MLEIRAQELERRESSRADQGGFEMRQRFVAVLGFVGVLAFSSSALALPFYTVQAPASVQPGDTFQVTVWLTLDNQDSLGSQFSLDYATGGLLSGGAAEELGVPPYELHVSAAQPACDDATGVCTTFEAGQFFQPAIDGTQAAFLVGQVTFTASSDPAGGDAAVNVIFLTGEGVFGTTAEAVCGFGTVECPNVNAVVNVVPEPGTLALLAVGLGVLGTAGRRS
jgi:hypothetical protein